MLIIQNKSLATKTVNIWQIGIKIIILVVAFHS